MLSDLLAEAMLVEAEVHVDANGYAHDDEGNRWFVGRSYTPGVYRPGQLPEPPATSTRVDNTKRISAFQQLPASQREGNFGRSILRQLQAGKQLSDKQKSAVRRMFYQAKLRDLANHFR